MKKSEIVKLPDNELILHYLEYHTKLKKASRRHWVLQCGWAKEEMDKRGLVKRDFKL